MILTILLIAVVSLIVIFVAHSLWGYFFDIWILPHIYSEPPPITPHIFEATFPENSFLGTTNLDELNEGSYMYLPGNLPNEVGEIPSISFPQAQAQSHQIQTDQSAADGWGAFVQPPPPPPPPPQPMTTQSDDIRASKQSLKQLFTSLKQESQRGGAPETSSFR